MRRRATLPRLAVALGLVSLAGAATAYAAGMPITSGHLFAAGQALTKTSCDQGAATASDTYVNQSSPTQDNGAATTITTRNNTGSERFVFIRFDIGGCGIPASGGADAATLTVRVTAANRANHTISAFPVYTSWTESLDWNGLSGLTIGSTATDSFTSTTGFHTLTVTADLDSAIKAGSFWGWELVDTAGGGNSTTTIASSENGTAGNRPSLTLAYEK